MDNISEVSIIISFVAGILTFLSPCVLPLFPSYIVYITGRSFNDIKDQSSSEIRRVTILHSLFFILGFSMVFVLLGVTLTYLGTFFGIKKIWLERVGGILIVLFGLHLLGVLKFGFLNQEKRLAYHREKISYFGSLLIGMAFSVGWTPCVGPILSSILIYSSTLEGIPRAVILLSFYSLGLGVPFLIGGVLVNQFLFLFNRFKAFMKFVPVVTGIFLIIIGILLFLGEFSNLRAEEVTLQKVDFEKAPEFTLLDIEGNEKKLSDFKGNVIILDFWATWCPPCRAEIPHFVDLYDKYKEEGLEVIGVALDTNAEKVLPPFIEKYGVNYTILVADGKVSDLYGGIFSIPTTFVIDRDFNIRKKYIGYRNKSVFEEDIEEML